MRRPPSALVRARRGGYPSTLHRWSCRSEVKSHHFPSDADVGTLRAISQSLQPQSTPNEGRANRRALRHAADGDMELEPVEDDDVDLTNRQLRDKEYDRLQQQHFDNHGKRPSRTSLYQMWEAAIAWAVARKSNAARFKKQKC